MAHQWQDSTPKGPGGWFRELRRCTRCGAEQEKIDDGTWGRVKWVWRPKVGRCPKDRENPAPDPRSDGGQGRGRQTLLTGAGRRALLPGDQSQRG